MRTLAISMALLFGTTAMAGSELQLKSNMPVILVLDDQNIGTVQPLEPLLVDIEPGVHNLRLKGMLGKDLYDRDLIFDDHTRTELVWQRKELRLGAVVQLDPNRAPDPDGTQEDLGFEPAEEVAAAPPNPAESETPPPQDMEHPEAVAAAPAPQNTARPPLTRPSAPPAPVAAAPAPIEQPFSDPTPVMTAPPVTKDVRAPTPPRAAPGGSVVIEATPGMDLAITHGSQKLRITVQNGELVVEDANGTEIHFPSDGEAW